MDRLSLWSSNPDVWPSFITFLVWVFGAMAASVLIKLVLSVSVARRDLRLSSLILNKVDASTRQRILQEISNEDQ